MPPPSALSYPTPPAYVIGSAISPLTPTVTGTVSAYSVSPALPAGLSLSTSTGVVSGTPTVISAPAAYTVTASNSSGSTATAVTITVNDLAPVFTYGGTNFTLTTQKAANLTPASSGGTVVTWSIGSALPAGLSFSTTDGSISGTPTAIATSATYVVTAQNSGGQAAVSLTLTVESGVLLDLGHYSQIVALRLTSSRVLSLDYDQNWVLWDFGTTALLARGAAGCRPTCPPQVDLAGQTLVIDTTTNVEVRAASDGHLLATLPPSANWWRLASDGSYICGGNGTGLTVWSPTGVVLLSRPGDYSKAAAFAAPGEVRVALGPAGSNVVETVSVPAATSSVGAAFQGQFHSWFLDGNSFLTNVGNTVWTYDKTGVQLDLTALPTIANLTGQGAWFWTNDVQGTSLNIYKVGASGAPAATYPVSQAIPSGLTINTGASIIDLSGSSPTAVSVTYPPDFPCCNGTYAALSSSQWVFSSGPLLIDVSSPGGTPRYFNLGVALSIAGSTERVAVATELGKILFFNAVTQVLEGTIDSAVSKVALSSDGTVLATLARSTPSALNDRSIRIYSLPSGTLTYTWPYTTTAPPFPVDITLSASGTTLGQILANSPNCVRQVTGVTGGPVLWSGSDTLSCFASPPYTLPILLSSDGTLIAVSDTKSPQSGTNLYLNGTLLTAVPGWAVGWLDNSHVLVNGYQYHVNGGGQNFYTGATVYDSSGVKLSTPPFPELGVEGPIQLVDSDSVYDPTWNKIFSISTGLPTWTTANGTTLVGAVAGARVVFAEGSLVLTQPR